MYRFVALMCSCFVITVVCKEFQIDYDQNRFVKDGKTFQIISGDVHYFNVPYQLWEDRLASTRDCGMNTVRTYLEWRTLEPQPGNLTVNIDFTGQNNISEYILTAQRVGLLVILRLGPYIDAERDLGGLPWWLLKEDPKMILRTNDPTYMKYVTAYWTRLSKVIKPFLYSNGGPVIMLQIENEYGHYYACDHNYTKALKQKAYELFGQNIAYYTGDTFNDRRLECGRIEGVLQAVHFGAFDNISLAFGALRNYQPKGPLFNSEFYTGWFDYWGWFHHEVPTTDFADQLDKILSLNASVSLYLMHGGTNFGFNSGSIFDRIFKICQTSYDYDAPLSEAGDPTNKCFAVKNVVKKYTTVSDRNPVVKKKMALGNVVLNKTSGLRGLLGGIRNNLRIVASKKTKTFEELNHPYGLLAYETSVPFEPTSPALLKVSAIRDRGYVFVDYKYQGILSRQIEVNQAAILAHKNCKLTILVENQGRLAIGDLIGESKGILGNVTLGKSVIENWNHLPIPYEADAFYSASPSINEYYKKMQMDRSELRESFGFGIFEGTVSVEKSNTSIILDTYLRFDGWNKGFVFINGVNLGRYWPNMGPQITLYVPGVYLKYGKNKILVIELEEAPVNRTISFVSTPSINGPFADLNKRLHFQAL